MIGNLRYEEQMEIAEMLYEAERTATPIKRPTERYPDMNIHDAYKIQEMGVKLRVTGRGRVIGRKLGATNEDLMRALKTEEPDFGCLLNSSLVNEGDVIRRSRLHHPRVEGELAFIMGEELKGPGVTIAEVYNATSWVLPCFEICDSRVEPPEELTFLDSIADNAGAARFMLGSKPKHLDEINPRLIGMVMERNGVVIGSAAGVEAMGNPVIGVTWLVNELARVNVGLKRGDIILSGAFLATENVEAGDVFTLYTDGFPGITLRFS
ncbi:MAG: fumarylacetoacetate hydrolase family protein [Stomatobaculum sp.]|nr:fumarylacetoacetate hydrolase family protein [Stomatobaculum sp.]